MSVAMGRIAVAAALGALVGGAVTVGLIATEGDTPVRDPHGGKEAAAYAESLLDRVALPKGARPFSGALPQDLAGAPWRTTLDSTVFQHRVYSVSAPPADVLAGAKARGIAGFEGSPSSGSSGPIDGPSTMTYDIYGERRPPPGIYQSDLTLSTMARGPRASLLRIDAQVVWRPIRTAAEHVSSSDQVVTIDRTILPQPGRERPTTQHHVVTDRATVARLTRLFEGLPTMPSSSAGNSAPPSCPAIDLEVKFAPSADAPPVMATGTDPQCFWQTWRVTARGQPQPALMDVGTFLAAVTAAEG